MPHYREKSLRVIDATQLTFSCIFDSGNGEQLVSNPGDWLVTEPNGEQCIMDDAEFQASFEPLKKQGRKTGSRNKSREEVESSGDASCIEEGTLAFA